MRLGLGSLGIAGAGAHASGAVRGGGAPVVRGRMKYARRFDARAKAERLTCVDGRVECQRCTQQWGCGAAHAVTQGESGSTPRWMIY